ncbi:LolA family protein [Eilatimonas milleporae]|uniref:Outer membrane lipoprotein-sorting protein n=1 Tax=Eilatimonas milleporae TaxID=911205 RepID=A0A3M0BW55_9PROT|nr:outer membrane lipoprotein carrier protein LolA [Eilatimonas milleporae]RMB01821.1 outer membrane lipoprotein-sorting protein [Eilatimonas milleporae]
MIPIRTALMTALLCLGAAPAGLAQNTPQNIQNAQDTETLAQSAPQSPPAGDQADTGRQDALPPLDTVDVAMDARLDALTRVREHLSGVETLTADFTQQAPDGTRSTGRLYMERPGKVRFDYTDETPFLIVADGQVLSFIDYEVGQVTRWPIADTPLRLVLDRQPDLAALGASIEVAPGGIDSLIALSAADPDRPELGRITLYFRRDEAAPGGLALDSWVVRDAQDGLTIVDLDNARRNDGPLTASLWQFEDPRGLARRRRTR